jgi:hypothetical protein
MRLLVLLALATGCPIASTPGTDKNDSGELPDVDGDGFTGDDDCNDEDGTVHVGAAELCDGLDNDCNNAIDDEAADATTWYADVDNDGAGDPAQVVSACEAPAGHVAVAGDCNDADGAYHPNADESDCTDPEDYNCDGSTGYADADGDGAPACEDCDDADPARNPSAIEVCNGEDDDCNAVVDDAADATVWYEDVDADGYGTETTVTACDQPDGYAALNGDCNDAAPQIHPSAAEFDCADPTDYNCDGSVGYADVDGDGSAACEECDDSDPAVFPGAVETCDSIDNNCDGSVDEDTAVDVLAFYADADSDGYGDAATTRSACAAPAGYVADTTDCDDSDAAEYPGADERCDGDDDDCDGEVDEASAVDAPTWYADTDGDGFGDATMSAVSCSAVDGYVADAADCDDTDAVEYPGADELCDGDDDDCDGEVDEDSAVDALTWYADVDGDGYGDPAAWTAACAAPLGYGADDQDCDDTDSAVNPAATESCNLLDDNCDGEVDEASADDAMTWYADNDGDSYGDAATSLVACEAPATYTAVSTDCDDDDAAEYPGADEMCDGDDDDCDGEVDEPSAVDAPTWYADADVDGFGDASASEVSCAQPSGYVSPSTDCDDDDPAINPAAVEICDAGDTDEDCSGLADDADPGASGMTAWYADADSDSYGDAADMLSLCDEPASYVTDATDCDDSDGAEYPGADELCDGDDDNCDGEVDEDSAVDAATWYADTDSDTYGNAALSTLACSVPAGFTADSTDCDDTDAAEYPGADERCDGDDDDCDGDVDENSAVDAATWYADTDSDSYGNVAVSTVACAAPAGFTADASDCDDTDAAEYPGADERCDGDDDDCDGDVDEDSAVDALTWYVDSDGDSYGNASFSTLACAAPSGYVASSTDCDDSVAAVNPGATEVCDALDVDEDCDGVADDADPSVTGESTWYADADGDGYGDPGSSTVSCSMPSGTVADDSDCDDTELSVYTGAPAVCEDGLINDCLTTTDDCHPSGTSALNVGATAQFVRTTASDALGIALARVGDVDDDGNDDLFFAGHTIDGTAGADIGEAYLYRGGATSGVEVAGTSPYAVMTGVRKNTSADYLGYQIAGAGDFDDDGFLDVFVGAYNTRAGTSSSGAGAAGEAILFSSPVGSGHTRATSSAIVRLVGVASSDYLGFDVAGGVDVNDDGVSDVVTGAYGYDPSAVSNAGAATVAFGGLAAGDYALTSTSVTTWTGLAASDQLGQIVGLHPDLDGDGIGDVLASAYKADQGGLTDSGAVYIVSGGSTLPASGAISSAMDASLSGEATNATFGRSIANAGDVDGDGTDDLIIGADGSNGSALVGTAYVFLSPVSTGTSSTAFASFSGGATNDYAGRSVEGDGDLNGDGHVDILVGATGYDSPASGTGGAFLWYGPIGAGASVLSSADLILTGVGSSDAAGGQTIFVGDSNADGFDDLLISASGYDYGGTSNTGSVFLFLGSGD